MSIEVIQNELKRYAAKSIQEEQQAIRADPEGGHHQD